MSTEKSDVTKLPTNIIRVMPYTAYVSVFSYAVIFASEDAFALTKGLILNELTNHLLKTLCKSILDPKIAARPDGAIDTGIFPTPNPKISTTTGMPSGHGQTAWFLATTLMLNVCRHLSGFSRIVSFGYVIAVASLVSVSRTKYGGFLCVHFEGKIRPPHTPEQVVAGSLVGVVLALITFAFL